MIKFRINRDQYHDILDDKGELIGFATFQSELYRGCGEFQLFDECDMENEFDAGVDEGARNGNAG